MLYEDLTAKIIKSFYEVYNNLGYGFLETIYEKALLIELKNNGVKVENQKEIEVFYKGNNIGFYKSDLMVEDKVIVEIKAVKTIIKEHEAQLINYLKSTGIKIGFLVNFGEKLEFKRMIFDSEKNSTKK